MFKALVIILLLSPCSIYSQANSTLNIAYTDTTSYLAFFDSLDGIFFLYPKNWEPMIDTDKRIFHATEKLTGPSDAYEENLFFLKSRNRSDLPEFSKNLSEAIKNENRRKIKVLGYEIKVNENGIEYGILKNTFREKKFQGQRTHVYFIKGDYKYGLIFSNDLGESGKYDVIFNTIIQSIGFRN